MKVSSSTRWWGRVARRERSRPTGGWWLDVKRYRRGKVRRPWGPRRWCKSITIAERKKQSICNFVHSSDDDSEEKYLLESSTLKSHSRSKSSAMDSIPKSSDCEASKGTGLESSWNINQRAVHRKVTKPIQFSNLPKAWPLDLIHSLFLQAWLL